MRRSCSGEPVVVVGNMDVVAVPQMCTIRYPHGFRRAVHIVGSITAMDMDIDKPRRYIVMAGFYHAHTCDGGRVVVDFRNTAIFDNHICVFENAVWQDHIAMQTELTGHEFSIEIAWYGKWLRPDPLRTEIIVTNSYDAELAVHCDVLSTVNSFCRDAGAQHRGNVIFARNYGTVAKRSAYVSDDG